jgi:8-oxo-dGTP pyrophosphatase MutT (NUDIX family)
MSDVPAGRRPQPKPPPVNPDLPTLRAAGGVLWRRNDGGPLEVVLVHRPRYDDWSFPKGKQDPGETDEDTARREVLEETGYVARITSELPALDYVLPDGQPKVVAWYAMNVVDGEFSPNDEVDALVWLPVTEAADLLTRPSDGVLLEILGFICGT